MKKTGKLAAVIALAASTTLAGCDLAAVIDDIKEQVAGALNVDPASLQKLLAQSSKSFSVAGEQVSGNLEQIAGGGQRAGAAPGGAPAFGAKAEGAACETVSVTDDAGTKTAIVDFSACTDRKGQIKVVIEQSDEDIISTMTYTDYSENAEDATNYVYYDGDMKWTMKVEAGEMSVASNNAYNTKYALEDTVAELYMTENLDLTYSDGGLVIDGSNTITEGDKTAILSFNSVTFDPATCPKGPSSGKINLKIGGDFVEITITACAEAIQVVSKDGEQTTVNMTGADLEAFFQEFAANLNTFDGQMASAAGKVEGIGALKDCNLAPNGDMAKFGGVWCAGFPASDDQAYVFCRQVCNVAADKAHPDYFMLEGVATWSGDINNDAPYGYIEPTALSLTCLDRSYVYEHGLVKYGQSVAGLDFDLDIVNIYPDLNFGYEGDMMDEPMPMAPGDPGEEFYYPAAWAASASGLNEYSAMSLMEGTTFDFGQEFLIFSYSKVDQTVADCTPEQMENLFAGDIAVGGGGQDFCADPANAEDPACSPEDYCMMYPEDPYCGGGGESWCDFDPYSVECACETNPYSFDCDPIAFCDADPLAPECQ